VIVAFAVFILVKQVNRLHKQEAAAPSAPPREQVLLEEIRDLLKAGQSVTAKPAAAPKAVAVAKPSATPTKPVGKAAAAKTATKTAAKKPAAKPVAKKTNRAKTPPKKK
jgi:large conductance mechanosensitive channel